MKRLTLNNAQQDPSMINTCMAYPHFRVCWPAGAALQLCHCCGKRRKLGLVRPRREHENRLFGAQFCRPKPAIFTRGPSAIFGPNGAAPFRRKPMRRQRTGRISMRSSAALQDPSPAGLEALAAAIDLDRFITFWAVEVLIGHWDGYAGNRNNFYIYREPGAPFVFIPWGADQVLTADRWSL